MKTQIIEWKEKQLQGKADQAHLTTLNGRLVNVGSSEEALTLVQEISEHIQKSKFCMMAASGVERLKGLLDFSKLMND